MRRLQYVPRKELHLLFCQQSDSRTKGVQTGNIVIVFRKEDCAFVKLMVKKQQFT